MGINAFLWIALLVGCLMAIPALIDLERASAIRPLIAPLLFSLLLAWRASPTLNLLAATGVLILLARPLLPRPFPVWLITFTKAGSLLADMLGQTLAGFPHLLSRDIDWSRAANRPVWRNAASVLIGLLIAAPLLAIFAALFSSADAVYKHQLSVLFDFNVADLVEIAYWTVLFCWLGAGYLRSLLLLPDSSTPAPQLTSRKTLGAIEVNTILLALNLLFLSFVVVQLKYLFGGAEIVRITPDLSYAEYARRGFFELVTAAALVLPLLLVADWIYTPNQGKLGLRLLSVSLIALLFVIMLSAGKRMQMYRAEYGLTELRFYVSAFILLLLSVFLWFCCTVARGKRERFLSGSILLALISVILLHVANPDAWIIRVNLDRAAEGKQFDAAHAASLSADALPILTSRISELPMEQRQELLQALASASPQIQNLRSWNWSRWRAAASH